MLLTSWQDPEDAFMHEVVLSLWVDAIISRNAQDYEGSFMPVLTCSELFEEFKNQGIVYEKLNGRAVAELLTFPYILVEGLLNIAHCYSCLVQ